MHAACCMAADGVMQQKLYDRRGRGELEEASGNNWRTCSAEWETALHSNYCAIYVVMACERFMKKLLYFRVFCVWLESE